MSKSFHKLKVTKVQPETEDTVSISFEIPKNLKDTFQYKQGQYLTLKFILNGKEERRSYSMCSSPLEPELAVAVKRVKKGKVSNHINDKVKVGTEIEIMPPEGRFFTELKEDHQKTYYLFGAGSGITPLMSILKTIVEKEPKSNVCLLYGNRREDSIIFKNQLAELQTRYEGQFLVEHILSQPKKEKSKGLGGFLKKGKISWQGKVGRISAKVVNQFLEDNPARSKSVECFLCGPKGMIESIENTLKTSGIDKGNIHKEYFVSADEVTEKAAGVDGAKLKATLDGKVIETTVPSGKTILNTLLDQKHDAPYSCTAGACATCMAKVLKGKVKMDACYALDDGEIADGYCLTCQAHPTTAEIEVTYDI